MGPFCDERPVNVIDVAGTVPASQFMVENHDGTAMNDETDGSPEPVKETDREIGQDLFQKTLVKRNTVVFHLLTGLSLYEVCDEGYSTIAGSRTNERVGQSTSLS